jgi:hypothetical protein
MRLRELVIAVMFTSTALVSVNALPPAVRYDAPEPDVDAPLPVEPSALISQDKVLGSAYYDTLSILSATNDCSDFFGGSAVSVEVFNKFIGKVQKNYFAKSIGMRMSGKTTNVSNVMTKSRYRLFDKVSVNTNGAFYRRKLLDADVDVPGVGSFKPNTKEVRVLMFLHELGHVMKGQDGKWLLPDDGKDEDLSRRNSQKIEKVCGDEIRSLGKSKATNLAEGKQPAESIAPARNMLNAVQ